MSAYDILFWAGIAILFAASLVLSMLGLRRNVWYPKRKPLFFPLDPLEFKILLGSVLIMALGGVLVFLGIVLQ